MFFQSESWQILSAMTSMDYGFFFSYASRDREVADPEAVETPRSDYLRIFYNDLNKAIRGLGIPDGGFFDKKRIEGPWRVALADGLATSRVLVPLYSPNYFHSEYCGKEWEVFRLRSQENAGSSRLADVTPTIILPVLWKLPATIPTEVMEFQYLHDEDPVEYKSEGLEYLIKFKRYNQVYQRFVDRFAKRIIKHINDQGAPKIRDVPDFREIYPSFPGSGKPGLKYVRYVFIAGVRNEMRIWRTKFDSYGVFSDRRDWRPWHPDVTAEAEKIVTRAAKDEGRAYEIMPSVPAGTALEKLREAKRLKNIIIIVVDPWSMKIPELRSFVDDFDKEEFANSGVLVSWNDNDRETLDKLPELQNEMKEYFRGRIGRKEFHKEELRSEAALEGAVREAFNSIRERLIQVGDLYPADPNVFEPQPLIRN
jgi:FxsC-like protein